MRWNTFIKQQCLTAGGDGASPADCADADYFAAHLQECCSDPDFLAEHGEACCADATFRSQHQEECAQFCWDDLEVCCEDPAYRALHPDQCGQFDELIIKPAVMAVCVFQTVVFRVYLRRDELEEEITSDVTFLSSNQQVLMIGALSGSATGLSEGIATVTAQWQNKAAYAQITVLPGEACCSAEHVGMLLLIDNSRSMGTAFRHSSDPPEGGGSWGSKLEFVKDAARRFVGEVDFSKDSVGLMTFNETSTLLYDLSDDVGNLKSAIGFLGVSSKKTCIGQALTDAINLMTNRSDITWPVIVLMTDGEEKCDLSVVEAARNFTMGGGVIVCLGVRAYGDGFALLSKISTAGYFVNAHEANGLVSLTYLSGMKGFFCAGDCRPQADTVNHAALDYTNFTYWEVISGCVDLIGGDPPHARFDLLPGNGLYLDLVGSSMPVGGIVFPMDDDVLLGVIQTKSDLVNGPWIQLEAGHTYRLRWKMAGNQRANVTGFVAQVDLIDVTTDDVLGTQTVTIDDWKQDFTEYSFDTDQMLQDRYVRIKIQQVSRPTDPPSHRSFGTPLDSVWLQDITVPETPSTVFYEDWDSENSVTLDPPCATEGDFGCYNYCLEEPLPKQVPEPNPPLDVEAT